MTTAPPVLPQCYSNRGVSSFQVQRCHCWIQGERGKRPARPKQQKSALIVLLVFVHFGRRLSFSRTDCNFGAVLLATPFLFSTTGRVGSGYIRKICGHQGFEIKFSFCRILAIMSLDVCLSQGWRGGQNKMVAIFTLQRFFVWSGVIRYMSTR